MGELEDVGDCVIEGAVRAIGSGHWCGCVDCPHSCAGGPSGGNAGRRVFDDEALFGIDTQRSGRQKVALRVRLAVADRFGVDDQGRLGQVSACESDLDAVCVIGRDQCPGLVLQVAQQRGSAVGGGVGAGSCVLIFELMQSIQAACRVVVRSDDREGFGRPCAQRDLVGRVGVDAELVRP
jgi:hypothetical protein